MLNMVILRNTTAHSCSWKDNMSLNPPSRVRAALYILTAVGTPLVAYLLAKGVISSLEVGLWSAEVTVVNTVAALNVVTK